MECSFGREKSESQRPVLYQRDQPTPAKGSPPPPFIVVRRGGVHEWEHGSRRFPLNHGYSVGHCMKCTVGRRRVSLSSWISSLVPRRWRRPSCSVRVIVMAWDGPGPRGRSAGLHTRRSGSPWKSRTPQGGGPGSRPCVLSALVEGHVTSSDPFPSGRWVRMVVSAEQ